MTENKKYFVRWVIYCLVVVLFFAVLVAGWLAISLFSGLAFFILAYLWVKAAKSERHIVVSFLVSVSLVIFIMSTVLWMRFPKKSLERVKPSPPIRQAPTKSEVKTPSSPTGQVPKKSLGQVKPPHVKSQPPPVDKSQIKVDEFLLKLRRLKEELRRADAMTVAASVIRLFPPPSDWNEGAVAGNIVGNWAGEGDANKGFSPAPGAGLLDMTNALSDLRYSREFLDGFRSGFHKGYEEGYRAIAGE